jgi:3-oxoacyl-[acyl-carrier-protein] synthase II
MHAACPACSTLVGDIAEVKAIKKVFTDTKHLKMNATKSLIGHCLGAAAGIEAVAVVKAIETGWLHPTLNQDNLVEEVAGIDTVPNEKKQLKVGVGCVDWVCGLVLLHCDSDREEGYACA